MFIYIHILSYYKLFLYFNLCLSVMLDSLSCSFTSISFLTITYFFTLSCVSVMLDSLSPSFTSIYFYYVKHVFTTAGNLNKTRPNTTTLLNVDAILWYLHLNMWISSYDLPWQLANTPSSRIPFCLSTTGVFRYHKDFYLLFIFLLVNIMKS